MFPLIIEAKNVEFSYKNHPVLSSLDFSADSGDTIAVLGPNGAGKSTLFRCLLGFLDPQKGSVHIGGKNLREMTVAEKAQHIAYIPQSAVPVFNYTVLETVLMGLTNRIGIFSSPNDADKKKAADILDSLGIGHLSGRGCGQISGGERQLTLLARALIQDAKVLIMDEPTANLDFGNSSRVMERTASLAETGYTVIFSTHDPNQAFMHASRVIAIKDGRILTSGSPRSALTEETLSELYCIGVSCHDILRSGENTRICIPV